jgi:hypothetical protein
MADQTVVTRMDVEGNAAEKVNDLGVGAKRAAAAVDEAKRELEELFRTGKGSAADFDRIMRGSRAAGGAGGSGAAAGGPSVPASAEADVPRATLDAERRNRLNLQEVMERDRIRFERGQERERKREEAEGGVGESAAGYKNPLAGTGFARLATPLFALHALSSEFEAFGRTLEKVGISTDQANHLGDEIARHLAESIPLLGGFARGLISVGEAVSGLSAAQAGALEAAENSRRQLAFAGGEQSARFQAAREQAALGRAAADARIGAGVSAEQLLRFQGDPALRASFRPDVVPFATNQQTGPLAFAEFLAQGRLSAASRVLTARGEEAASARRNLGADQLADRIAEQDNALRAADRRRRDAERSFEQRPDYTTFRRAAPVFFERQRRERELTEATSAFAERNREVLGLRGQQQERFNALKEAEVRLSQAAADKAQAAYSLEESRVNVARNQVALRQQEFNAAQNRSEFFGTAGRGEQLAALEAARRLNEGAQLRDLPPQLQGLVRQLAPDQFRERARQEGQGPELAEFNRLLGVKPQGEAGDALKRATDILNEAQLKADTVLKTALAATDEAKAQRLAEIINASMDNRIALLVAKLRDQQGVAKQKQ